MKCKCMISVQGYSAMRPWCKHTNSWSKGWAYFISAKNSHFAHDFKDQNGRILSTLLPWHF